MTVTEATLLVLVVSEVTACMYICSCY